MLAQTHNTLSASAVVVPGNAKRKLLIISNNSDTVMTYLPGGTAGDPATGTKGISIPGGQTLVLSKVEYGVLATLGGSLFCAGANKAYSIFTL